MNATSPRPDIFEFARKTDWSKSCRGGIAIYSFSPDQWAKIGVVPIPQPPIKLMGTKKPNSVENKLRKLLPLAPGTTTEDLMRLTGGSYSTIRKAITVIRSDGLEVSIEYRKRGVK